LRKLQRRRELRKKWNKRKRERNITNIESSEEDSYLKAKTSRTESPRRISIKGKKTEKATSISKREKINKNLPEETPLHKHKIKLKQTKLNFQTQKATNSNTNETSLFESKLYNKPKSKQSKIAKLITSTPRCSVSIKRLPLSPSLDINSITSIETITKTINKLDDSKNSDELGNRKTPEKKTQERNDRLLRSNTKSTGLLSQVLKTNQRLTRSQTKS